MRQALVDATTDTRLKGAPKEEDVEAFARMLDAVVAAGYNAGGVLCVKRPFAEKLGLIEGPTWRRGIKYYISFESPDSEAMKVLRRTGAVKEPIDLDALYADCAKGGTA